MKLTSGEDSVAETVHGIAASPEFPNKYFPMKRLLTNFICL